MFIESKRFFYSFFTFIIISFNVIASQYSHSRDDYFDIARSISLVPLKKENVLKHIMRDHIGTNPDKSHFFIKNKNKILDLIDEVLKSPTHLDFTRSAKRLMIIKDFTQNEVKKFSEDPDYIGVFVTHNGQEVKTNRVTIIFDHANVEQQGFPWNGELGFIATCWPDNPNRQY